MDRDDATLLDIARAGWLIQDFVAGVSYENFPHDQKTQSATLHQLLVIGEAVKRLSPRFRSQHTEIPWSLMAGMRDHIVHAYDAVDLDEVWHTVTADIPELLEYIQSLLPEQPSSSSL